MPEVCNLAPVKNCNFIPVLTPAKYWEDFRDKYRCSGITWSIISTLLTGVIVAICIVLIKKFPEQIFSGDKLVVENAIKWTIVLALMFSSLFYLLRISIRLVLSSFHLSRDANERLQLTHQYLSLLSENVIDEKHREIIIQALFSRAETGLLKGDSTPAIPESVLSNILKNIK